MITLLLKGMEALLRTDRMRRSALDSLAKIITLAAAWPGRLSVLREKWVDAKTLLIAIATLIFLEHITI